MVRAGWKGLFPRAFTHGFTRENERSLVPAQPVSTLAMKCFEETSPKMITDRD